MLLFLLPLAACGGHRSAATTPASSGTGSCSRVKQPALAQRIQRAPTGVLDPAKAYDVVMKTNCGSFTIRLDPRQSPHAVASFVALAKAGYFDHTIFDRIVPGLLIQGGDPTATETGGPGYTTVDKPPKNASYHHGVVAMAKTPAQVPGTAGSQFFVVTATDARLPPDYAIIGRVVMGIDVVDRIGTLGGGNDLANQVQNTSGLPSRVVEVEHTTVVTT